jgi:nucleotide-binding universal stress UspA family protein
MGRRLSGLSRNDRVWLAIVPRLGILGESIMKDILMLANSDAGFAGRLGVTMDLARLFDAHLSCIQTTAYDAFLLTDPFGGMYALPEVVDRIRTDEEAHRQACEEKLRGGGVPWTWLHGDGEAAQVLAQRSRLADLVVVSIPEPGERPVARNVAGDLAIHARGPVVAVPNGANRFDGFGAALVAWNGSAESSHGLRAALPLLKKAGAVHIVTVSDDRTDFPATEACEYLSRHGVRSELHEWPREDRPVADRLLDAASVLKAGYIVAGAYGHTRLREAVLGGATRDLLDRSTVPLVLTH